MVDVVATSAPGAIDRACAALASGAVIVIPTDTVYGVAVNPFLPGATDRLFAAKRRPRDVTLPVLVGSVEDVADVAVVNDVATDLMRRYWPGGLTIVLPRVAELRADLGTNESTVGVRCPDHDFVRELLRATGPLAVTSANLHGDETPPSAGGVAAVFGDAVALVVDGGVCEGAPSTVVDCSDSELRVLRQGALQLG